MGSNQNLLWEEYEYFLEEQNTSLLFCFVENVLEITGCGDTLQTKGVFHLSVLSRFKFPCLIHCTELGAKTSLVQWWEMNSLMQWCVHDCVTVVCVCVFFLRDVCNRGENPV